MMAAGQLMALGQKAIEVPTPSGRVFPAPVTLGLGGVYDPLDTPPQSGRGFWLCEPDRLQNLQDIVCRNLVDRMIAKWRSVRGQRRLPLRTVLLVSPLRGLCRDKRICDLAKGWDYDWLEGGCIALHYRIAAGAHHVTGFFCLQTGGSQRYATLCGGAQAHLTPLAIALPHEQPARAALFVAVEVEAAAIGMTAGPQSLNLLYLQPVQRPRHHNPHIHGLAPPSAPPLAPDNSGLLWTQEDVCRYMY